MIPAKSTHLILFAGGEPEAQTAAAVASLPSRESIVVATGTPDHSARLVAQTIQRGGGTVRLIAPSRSLAGAWVQARTTDWAEIDVGERASRLSKATLSTVLTNAQCVVAVNTITSDDASDDPIAIGLWAQFAHPRQRTGAHLSDPRDGLTAEIALAVEPRLILLFAVWGNIPILIASGDQIAAELAGLALRQAMGTTGPNAAGPWEYPLVQRATELDLGVATPAQIRPEVRWLGAPDDPAVSGIRSFATELFGRIGVVFDG